MACGRCGGASDCGRGGEELCFRCEEAAEWEAKVAEAKADRRFGLDPLLDSEPTLSMEIRRIIVNADPFERTRIEEVIDRASEEIIAAAPEWLIESLMDTFTPRAIGRRLHQLAMRRGVALGLDKGIVE